MPCWADFTIATRGYSFRKGQAATLARGDGASDRGKWWVSGSQLCQRWSSWMEGKSYCYTLTRRGNSVSWVRNDGRSGSARIG